MRNVVIYNNLSRHFSSKMNAWTPLMKYLWSFIALFQTWRRYSVISWFVIINRDLCHIGYPYYIKNNVKIMLDEIKSDEVIDKKGVIAELINSVISAVSVAIILELSIIIIDS